jgi:hypothetical protein
MERGRDENMGTEPIEVRDEEDGTISRILISRPEIYPDHPVNVKEQA